MTAVQDHRNNGHPVPIQPLEPNRQDQSGRAESPRVRQLRDQLDTLTAERDVLTAIAEVDTDPVLAETRSEQERQADRAVAEQVRTKRRKDTLRAGKSGRAWRAATAPPV